MKHPSSEVRNLRRRVDRARNFPHNTCPSSRHVQMIAEGLLRGGYPMLQEEPEYCAISLLATVESLWKARTEIGRLKERLARTDEDAA